MTKRTKAILTTVAKFGIVFALVAYVLLSGRLDLDQIKNMQDRTYAMMGAATLLLIPFVGWIRYWVLLRAQGIPLGLFKAFQLQLIGIFFNTLMPGAVGGDVLKAYYVATDEGRDRKPQAVMTVLIDRIIGMMGLFLVLGVAAPLAWSMLSADRKVVTVTVTMTAIYGGVMAFCIFLVIPRFRERRRAWLSERCGGKSVWGKIARGINGMDQGIQEMVTHPWATVFCLGISAVGHIVTITAFYFFGQALGITDVTYRQFAVLAPIALAANAFSFLPMGGAGAGEFFASVVFGGAAGLEPWVGGTVLFMWRLSLYIPAPLGLVWFLTHRQDVKRAQDAAKAGLEETCVESA